MLSHVSVYSYWWRLFQSTYDYGKQLLQASLGLRRSLHMDVAPNVEQTRRLEEAWQKFSQQISQQLSQRHATELFERRSEEVSQAVVTSPSCSRGGQRRRVRYGMYTARTCTSIINCTHCWIVICA